MKIFTSLKRKLKDKGFALCIVMAFLAISLTALTGALRWTSSSTLQTMRNVQYFTTLAAAEASTEKVLSHMLSDYQTQGDSEVMGNLSSYQSMIPTSTENSYWSSFEFKDDTGAVNKNYVQRVTALAYIQLDGIFAGLSGWASTYRVISNARQTGTSYPNVVGAIGQDIRTESIPVFQFAIFYGLDLELHSMTKMDILGRVHSNRDMYTYPSATTTFWQAVTTVGTVIPTRKPGDPSFSNSKASGSTIYKIKNTDGVFAAETLVNSLNLPIGTNNTPSAVREVLNAPPAGEDINSAMAKQRYYNKAELVITVTNNAVTAFAKAPYGTTTYSIASPSITAILATNASFTDQREGKVIEASQIDVSKLENWSKTNVQVTSAIGAGRPVNLIYINDARNLPSTQLAAIRLVNGSQLPDRGLTVATPNPLYVLGNYNQPTAAYLGTTNTSTTLPASLVSDAMTILSGSWTDSKSTSAYTSRVASTTTLNAALLSGIVETTNSPSIYSGGAHNLARYLEDWSDKTFAYNGSMVVLFPSIKATKPFQQPGAYYDPPTRQLTFDLNFTDGSKLPPGTPEFRYVDRRAWQNVTPGQTAMN